MKYLARKLRGADDDIGPYWIVFEHGQFSDPLVVLYDFDAKKLAYQILGIEDENNDPQNLQEAREAAKRAWKTSEVLFKQCNGERPLMEECPNCGKRFSAKTAVCDDCNWPDPPRKGS